MNKIRHICYMIGEDLGIGGLKAIEEFPENKGVIEQLIFMSGLLTELENKSKSKFKKRSDYAKGLLSRK